MSQIESYKLTYNNNAAHFLFIKELVARAEADENVSKNCQPQIEALKKALKTEDECFAISSKSLATDKIAEADALRDKIHAGYKKIVQAYLDFPLSEYANAATVLNQHIIDYKINVRDQINKETDTLVNFIQDLEGIHQSHVETLGLTVVVEQLKAANETVREHTNERTDERSTKILGAMKQARIDSDEAYSNLVNIVNARMMLEGNAPYENFANFVNAQIAQYKQEIATKRRTKSKESPAENSPLE